VSLTWQISWPLLGFNTTATPWSAVGRSGSARCGALAGGLQATPVRRTAASRMRNSE
jgi:hypothetical protein